MDILIIDDEKIIRDSVSMLLEDAGHYAEAACDSATALAMLSGADYHLILLDVNIGTENGLELLAQIHKKYPDTPVVVFTAAASIQRAVEAMRLGAIDFLEKPFTRQQFALVLSRLQKHTHLVEKVVELKQQVDSQGPEAVFDSSSTEMQAIFSVLFRAAASTASILILGESGTGKTVAARAVHAASPRAGRPFITVNSPGLSRELIESELFGHVKGSFTGAAKDHWGKVKAAEGGTLFLDEIGELPLDLQAKLLRLLQDREYERVGETATRKADVRVIAATNRDLARCVQEGTFREDLFYRLNVITVEMPPLRRRKEDLVPFAESYLRHFTRQFGRKKVTLSPAARAAIQSHSWPGNLREMRNAIERAVILCAGSSIEPADLPLATSGRIEASRADAGSGPNAPVADEKPPTPLPGSDLTLEQLEAAHIRAILDSSPSLTEAARRLGIDQATLYRKRKRMNPSSIVN